MQKNDADKNKIDSASLIDLKAELFRKQEEYKAQKLTNQNASYIKGKPSTSQKKPSIWSKKNKGVTERAEKDYEEKIEEENIFEQSKKSLENKARLYNQIANSNDVPEEDGSNFFLVDFQKKVIDDREDRKKREILEKKEREDAEEEERPVSEPETPDEEWVDFTDSLGRSRRCLRADLPSLQQRDQDFYQEKIVPKEKAAKDFQELRDKSGDRDLMSKDMLRDSERQRWEKEEEEKMAAEKEGPIHYGDVLHNEIRTHGVAFYKFDTDEDKRQKQMDDLLKMREETKDERSKCERIKAKRKAALSARLTKMKMRKTLAITNIDQSRQNLDRTITKDERSKSERIKAKRKAALSARLAKVKQRKREKLGLPVEEEETVDSDDEIGPKLDEAVNEDKEPEMLTRDDDWRKNMVNKREWDKGKQELPERSEQAWLERQRSERFDEFAPPTFYYDKNKTSKQNEGVSFSATFDVDGKKREHNDPIKTMADSTSWIHESVDKQLKVMRSKLDTKTDPDQTAQVKTDVNFINTSTTVHTSQTQSHQHGNTSTATCQSLYMTPPPVSESTNQLTVDVSVPPPPLHGHTAAPPSHGMAPPPLQFNTSVPPPPLDINMSDTPTVNYAPPTINYAPPTVNYSQPPQVNFDLSVPPPPLPNQATGYTQQMINMGTAISQPVWNANSTNQPMNNQNEYSSQLATPTSSVSTNPVSANEDRKKFVPRMDILDTRFMESD